MAKHGWDQMRELCECRAVPSDWMEDNRQSNALRVETASVSSFADRCTMQPPEHWAQGAKDRGALWMFSGGSPLVFGECRYDQCPKREF
jgi:hypothetical protein